MSADRFSPAEPTHVTWWPAEQRVISNGTRSVCEAVAARIAGSVVLSHGDYEALKASLKASGEWRQ